MIAWVVAIRFAWYGGFGDDGFSSFLFRWRGLGGREGGGEGLEDWLAEGVDLVTSDMF